MKIHSAALAALFLPVLMLATTVSHSETDDKFLYFTMNEHTVIIISNVPCVLDKYKKEYPHTAIATRSDGAKLLGCFKPQDENYIKIQWEPINGKESDFTVFPANVFMPEVQVYLKPELYI